MYKVKKETIIAQIDFIREMHKIDMTNVYLVKRYANLYCFYELLSAISGDEKSYIRYIEERRKEWIPIIVPDFKLIEKVRKEGAVKLMKLDKTDIDTYEREMKKIRHKKYIDYLKELDKERIKRNEKKKHTDKEIENQKEKFEKGLRVKLVKRQNIHLPPINTTGVVRFVDDLGNVHVLFDEATCEIAYFGIDELEVVDDYREESYKLKMFKEMDELRIEEGIKNFLNIDYVKIEAANYHLSSIVTLIEEHKEKYIEYATEYMKI